MTIDKNAPDIANRIDVDLLDRYMSGRCTEEEKVAFEATIQSSEPHRVLLHEIRELSAGPAVSREPVNVESGWSRVQMATGMLGGIHSGIQHGTQSVRPPERYGKYRVLGYVRPLGILCGVLLGWLIGSSSSAGGTPDGHGVRYSTSAGVRSTFTLIDGTSVSLNSDSYVEITGNYGIRDRAVRLKGNGYFRVNSSSDIPYTIVSDRVQTRVLGTEFSVSDYEGDQARVSVESGRVAVNDTVINANESVYLDQQGRLVVLHGIINPNDIAFASGRMILKDLKLRDAIREFNRWYGVDVRISNEEIGNLHISGTFASGDVSQLKEMLEEILDIEVGIKDRTVTLAAKKRITEE